MTKDKQKWIDGLFILYFALAPIAQQFLPNDLILEYWFPIYFTSYFVFSFPYTSKPKRFCVLVVVSFAFSIFISKVMFGNAHGYFLVFVLVYLKFTIIPSLLGFVAAKNYKKLLEKNLLSSTNKIVMLAISPILLVIGGVGFISISIFNGNFLHDEINKRSDLAKNIASYYQKTKIKNLNTSDAIELGIIKPLYEVSDEGALTHGYNGEIQIISNVDGISLIYKNIPKGKVCHWFYFMNTPSPYGFRDIYVNGISTKTKSNTAAMAKKDKEVCYGDKETVTVEYFATYSELDKVRIYN